MIHSIRDVFTCQHIVVFLLKTFTMCFESLTFSSCFHVKRLVPCVLNHLHLVAASTSCSFALFICVLNPHENFAKFLKVPTFKSRIEDLIWFKNCFNGIPINMKTNYSNIIKGSTIHILN